MKNDELCREIGNRIRGLRIEKKMTQSQLCSGFVTRNMISNIENGKAMPSLPTLCHIAEILDTEPGYFLGEGENQRQKRLLEIIKNNYSLGNYLLCLEYSEELSDDNGEVIGLKLSCLYYLGLENMSVGNFKEAKDCFDKASVLAYRSGSDYPYYNDCRMFSDYITSYSDGGTIAAVMAASSHVGCFSELPRFCLIYMMTVNKMAEAAETLMSLTEFKNNGYKLILSAILDRLKGKYELAKGLFAEAAEYLSDPIFSIICYEEIEKCGLKMGNFEMAYSARNKKDSITEEIKSKNQ